MATPKTSKAPTWWVISAPAKMSEPRPSCQATSSFRTTDKVIPHIDRMITWPLGAEVGLDGLIWRRRRGENCTATDCGPGVPHLLCDGNILVASSVKIFDLALHVYSFRNISDTRLPAGRRRLMSLCESSVEQYPGPSASPVAGKSSRLELGNV